MVEANLVGTRENNFSEWNKLTIYNRRVIQDKVFNIPDSFCNFCDLRTFLINFFFSVFLAAHMFSYVRFNR